MNQAEFDAILEKMDGLLRQRVAEYPRRVPESFAERRRVIFDLADQLLACSEQGGIESKSPPAWLDRPVFVGGAAKSGTSLITQLLDDHPALRVMPGDSSFASQRFGRPADQTALDVARHALGRAISPMGVPPFWTLGRTPGPYQRLLAEVLAYYQQTELDAFRCVVCAHQRVAEVERGRCAPQWWVEKTPGNELEVTALAEEFPQARFIHVLRHPLVNLSSLKRLSTQSGRPFDAIHRSGKLARSFDACRENLKRWGAERYWVVRYEDVTAEPEGFAERAAEFLDIQPDARLAVPTIQGQPAAANSMYADKREGQGKVHRATDPTKQVEGLSRAELATAVSLIAPSHASDHYDWDPDVARLGRGSLSSLLRYRIAPLVQRRLRRLKPARDVGLPR